VRQVGCTVEREQSDHERHYGTESEQLQQAEAAARDVRRAQCKREVEQHRQAERDAQQPEIGREPAIRATRLLPQRHEDFDEACHRQRTQDRQQSEQYGLDFHAATVRLSPRAGSRVGRDILRVIARSGTQ
jgi:hypothetical protein